MSVKTIFKTLIGTIVVIVVTAMIVEYVNISTTASQLKGTMMRSISKACDYISQETYKTGASGNIVGNMPDLTGRGGTIAGSGRFYMSNNADDVYNDLYRSSDFTRFMLEHAGTWKNLDMLFYGIYEGPVAGGYNLTAEDKENGKKYSESHMTALNIGIPYLDKGVLERIATYNIILSLSGGNPNNIYNDVSVSNYVYYRGFKVYYETIKVSGIDYTVYDITKSSDRKALKELTNIDASKLNLERDSTKVCIANISYSMKLSYEGVSPLKNIMKYVWDLQVDGLNGTDTPITSNIFNEGNISTLNQDTASGQMPVDGQIIYYIIK